MKLLKRILICGALLGVMTNFCMFEEVQAASNSSGVGLSAHCIKAYNENWQYVYGSATPGYVDCSGLIWTYNGVGGNRCDMLGSSREWGYVSNGIPRIHGLGLHQPGHVGVYIGSNQAIDARGTGYNCVLHNPYSKSWVEWFKISGVSYPNTGWVLLDGKAYYYENGQYIVDTQRTFDNVTYTFNSLGISDILPPDNVYTETDYSNIKVNTVVEQPVTQTKSQEQIDAERIAAERAEAARAEQARIAAEKAKQQRIAAERAEQERIAKKKAEQERIAKEKAEKERKAQIETERQEALKRKEERRIKREINSRKEKVQKNKSLVKFKKMVNEMDKNDGLKVSDDNFSSCNILIAKNSTLNNNIKINNIENEDKKDVIIDLSSCSHFAAGDSETKEKAKTEYMDMLYSDVFEFNNDVMAYSVKEDDSN